MRILLISLLLLIPHLPANAKKRLTAPEGGEILVSPEDIHAFIVEEHRGGRSELVKADGPGFDRAIRIESDRRGKPWDAEPWIAIDRPIQKGEVFLLHLWLRKIESQDESTQALVEANLGMRRDPWSMPISRRMYLSGGWQEFWIPGKADRDLDQGDLFLRFFAGELPQVVEIGGITLWTYGTDASLADLPATTPSYAGMEEDAAWRKDAHERIQGLRAGPLQVQILGENGQPIPGAHVEVDMLRHAFPFGSAISAAEIAGPDPAANQRARQQFLSLFNAGTFYNDLKWPAWVGEWDENFDREQTLEALAWFRGNHLPFRGHVLVWPSWHNLPAFLQARRADLSIERIQDLVLAHIDEITLATAGFVSEWDVQNEPRENRDLMERGGDRIAAQWFQRARQRLPEVDLALNEFGLLTSQTDETTVNPHLATVRKLLEAGAPLTVLGVQGHMGGSFSPPERILHVLDRLAEAGLPLRITEYTIRTEFPDLVESYSRDFLLALFSHPRVIGVQTWGTGVMFHEDGSLTAAGKAWHRLIREDWWTRAAGTTNDQGEFAAQAFFGRYRVTATANGRTLSTEIDHHRNAAPIRLAMTPRGDAPQ